MYNMGFPQCDQGNTVSVATNVRSREITQIHNSGEADSATWWHEGVQRYSEIGFQS